MVISQETTDKMLFRNNREWEVSYCGSLDEVIFTFRREHLSFNRTALLQILNSLVSKDEDCCVICGGCGQVDSGEIPKDGVPFLEICPECKGSGYSPVSEDEFDLIANDRIGEIRIKWLKSTRADGVEEHIAVPLCPKCGGKLRFGSCVSSCPNCGWQGDEQGNAQSESEDKIKLNQQTADAIERFIMGPDGWGDEREWNVLTKHLDSLVGEDEIAKEDKPTIIQCPYCKVVYEPGSMLTTKQLIELAGETLGEESD